MTESTHNQPADRDDVQRDADQDAEPASVPTGAAARTTSAETEDQDAGPASEPQER